MALHADVCWEVRGDGTWANGGGYKSSAGTTDYSQQDAAQLTVADGATSGIGVTTLTSATGGFTAAMVGNLVHLLTGTNLTEGFYEITGYTDTNTVTLDRAPDDGVGGVSGADCKVGGAITLNTTTANLEDWAENHWVAGHTIYIESGTHTLGGTWDVALDGTTTAPIRIIGYLEGGTRSHLSYPLGDNRPLINAGANATTFDDYYIIQNLRVATTSAAGLRADIGSRLINCDVVNTSPTASRYAINVASTAGEAYGCSAKSTKGYGVFLSTRAQVYGCFVRDSNLYGIWVTSNDAKVVGCCVDSCGSGIFVGGNSYVPIWGNTVRNCVTGIDATTGHSASVLNNIIADCYEGAEWSSAEYSDWWDYNNWYGNTTDLGASGNVTKGPHATALDPGFTSGITKGTDGATDVAGTSFTSAGSTFQTDGTTTDDVLVIKEGGTGATVGVYPITAVNSEINITIGSSAGASKSGITFGITHGEDLSVGTNMKAAANPGIYRIINDDGTTATACTSYLDQGAVQRQEPAGGGGTTVPQTLHPIDAGISA